MLDKLRDFIMNDYVAKHKEIDDEYFYTITSILSNHYGLEDVILSVKFGHSNIEGNEAHYDNENKEIVVNRNQLNKSIDAALRIKRFSYVEKQLFPYIICAKLIFHEVTHAVQYLDTLAESMNFIPDGKRSIVASVDPFTKANIIYSINRNGEDACINKLKKWNAYIDKKFLYDVVHERDAEIQAYSLAYTLLKGHEDIYPNIIDCMKAHVHSATIMGYSVAENGDVIAPTYLYAKALRINNMISADVVPWYDENAKKAMQNYPKTSDRFRLGLPVTDEEYTMMESQLKKYYNSGLLIWDYGFKADALDR